MKSSEKLKLKRKVPANKSNSRFSKGHFWENKMCQNSITCQSKLSFWVSKIKIGPLLSYFIFKCFISFKICQINYNLLTPISHPFHLTSFLRPDNLKRKLTVCSGCLVYSPPPTNRGAIRAQYTLKTHQIQVLEGPYGLTMHLKYPKYRQRGHTGLEYS